MQETLETAQEIGQEKATNRFINIITKQIPKIGRALTAPQYFGGEYEETEIGDKYTTSIYPLPGSFVSVPYKTENYIPRNKEKNTGAKYTTTYFGSINVTWEEKLNSKGGYETYNRSVGFNN